MSIDPDYYELLEVPVDAGAKEIVATYRRLARLYHPDFAPDPASTQFMSILNKAVEVLSDPKKRQEYDRRRLQAIAREALARESGEPAWVRNSPERPPIPPRPSTGVPRSRALARLETAIAQHIPAPAGPIFKWSSVGRTLSPIALAAGVTAAILVGVVIGFAIDSGKSPAGPQVASVAQPSPTVLAFETPAVSADPSANNPLAGENVIVESSAPWLVGSQVSPGIWRAVRPESCSWRRMSSAEATDNAVIATGSWLTVEIRASDAAFWSEGCGGWSQVLEPPSTAPEEPFGPGTWLVGEEIAPGLWQNSDSSQGCSWARLGKLDGGPSSMTANGSTDSTTIVIALGPRDVGFDSKGCGTWSRISG